MLIQVNQIGIGLLTGMPKRPHARDFQERCWYTYVTQNYPDIDNTGWLGGTPCCRSSFVTAVLS